MFVLLAISLFAQSTLAVVEKKAGKVGFYTVEGKRTGEVQTGAFPHEMVFSPDRRFLYVTDNGMLWMTDKGEGGNTDHDHRRGGAQEGGRDRPGQ